MNLAFAIPSYRREKEIKEKTLATLSRLEVPSDLITVFVANEEEYKLYSQELDGEVRVVIGRLGIGEQRKFINNYYDEGTRIVSLDDDVKLIRKNDNKVVELDEPLVPLVTKVFDLCDSLSLKFWGIPDTANGFFMKHEWVSGLRGTCGAFFGEYARLSETQSSLSHSEDLEKTLLHYRLFGGILRLNDISVKQKRLAKGGVNAHLGGVKNRFEVYREVTDQLIGQYPDLVSSVNPDNPEKGLTKVKLKTTGRYPSLLKCASA
jgi:hypothetical protein